MKHSTLALITTGFLTLLNLAGLLGWGVDMHIGWFLALSIVGGLNAYVWGKL